MKTMIALAITLAASLSFADQQQILSIGNAVKAADMIDAAKTVQTLCEPCGETSATTLDIEEVSVFDAEGFSNNEVQVVAMLKGGRQVALDLAYTYIDGKNLAMLLDLPVEGVSEKLP